MTFGRGIAASAFLGATPQSAGIGFIPEFASNRVRATIGDDDIGAIGFVEPTIDSIDGRDVAGQPA